MANKVRSFTDFKLEGVGTRKSVSYSNIAKTISSWQELILIKLTFTQSKCASQVNMHPEQSVNRG